MWARTELCIFNLSCWDVLTTSDYLAGGSNAGKQVSGLSPQQLDLIWNAIREGKQFIDLRKE